MAAPAIPKIGDSISFKGKVIVVNNYEEDTKAVIQLDDGQIVEISLDYANPTLAAPTSPVTPPATPATPSTPSTP